MRAMAKVSEVDDVVAARRCWRSSPATSTPTSPETVAEHLVKTGHALAGEFEFGLDSILNGLERLCT